MKLEYHEERVKVLKEMWRAECEKLGTRFDFEEWITMSFVGMVALVSPMKLAAAMAISGVPREKMSPPSLKALAEKEGKLRGGSTIDNALKSPTDDGKVN